MSHTPGPWEYLGKTSGWFCEEADCHEMHPFVLGPNGENPICYLKGEWRNEHDDARLIAAAPDLLNMLDDALEWWASHAGSRPPYDDTERVAYARARALVSSLRS